MTRTTLRHALLLATAATGVSLGFSAPADAASPAVMQIAPGIGGPKETEGGAGQEQLHVALFNKGGKQYVVSVYMSSNVEEEDSPWQCKCTSAVMDPIVGPVVVVDQKQLTKNGGNRPCNHPRIASNGADLGVWTYGTNEANGNTRTYVQGINEMCELVTDRLRISENNNQNEGAPDIAFNKEGAQEWFTAGYLSTANNTTDATYLVGVVAKTDNGTATVQKMWHKQIVKPANIGRPAIVEAGPDRVFACAAQGYNRPPEEGVTCVLVNTLTGDILHKELIAKSDEANELYFNQPSIAKIGPNTFAVQVLSSNGLGRKDNQKGSNTPYIYAFKVSPDIFEQVGYIGKVGKYPTHSSICGGAYGEKGNPYVAVMGASPTGLGQPSIQFVQWNGVGFKVDEQMDNWTMGFYGDAGLIANLYGPNPDKQGRDFLRCIGDVPNPGYGVPNGYMSDVETFFLAPHAGNIPGDPKNAAYISWVPGKVGKALVPEAPKEQPKQGITPPEDVGTGGTGGSTGSNGNGGGGSEGEGSGGVYLDGPQTTACSVPSAPSGTSPLSTAFLALGIGALFAARRRK